MQFECLQGKFTLCFECLQGIVQSSHLLLCGRFMTASFMTASFSICIIALLSSLAHSSCFYLKWSSQARHLFWPRPGFPIQILKYVQSICNTASLQIHLYPSLFSNFFQNVINSLVFCPLHPINIFLHHYISKLSLESFHVLFSECPTFIQSNTPIKFFDQLLFGGNYCTRMILFFLNFPFAKPSLHLISFSFVFVLSYPSNRYLPISLP